MKQEINPGISVIIPAYNEEKRLPGCLKSIKSQDYRGNLELLIVDDNSTDNTVKVAKRFGAKVLKNGSHNIEIGKSIGFQNAKHDFIFLIDADNTLPSKEWLSRSMSALQENPDAVGAQASWFEYKQNHPAADRYCELFGINDPVVYYIGKRDKLMHTEDRWTLPGKVIKDTEDYSLVEFDKDTLPTLGSQGFLAKKNLFFKTNYKPHFFHIDSNLELVEQGHNRFLMMKFGVVHNHCKTLGQFTKKLHRNMRLFLKNRKIKRYKYKTNSLRTLLVILSMVTLIRPTYHSIRGYLRKKDPAWFLHPLLSFYIPFMYLWITAAWIIKSALGIQHTMEN